MNWPLFVTVCLLAFAAGITLSLPSSNEYGADLGRMIGSYFGDLADRRRARRLPTTVRCAWCTTQVTIGKHADRWYCSTECIQRAATHEQRRIAREHLHRYQQHRNAEQTVREIAARWPNATHVELCALLGLDEQTLLESKVRRLWAAIEQQQ